MATNTYTAVIEQEGDAYVAFCPDLDIAARGRLREPPAPLNLSPLLPRSSPT